MSAKTHFGFETVTPVEKTQKVGAVFSKVASRYDIMNDLMSWGLHRAWKRCAVAKLNVLPGQSVLDLAGGSGDLTRLIAPYLKNQGELWLSDINNAMLTTGRNRLLNAGITFAKTLQANAEALPLGDQTFDRIIIGFGLRNVTDKAKALREMARVLKPGGQVLILEFSKPTSKMLRAAYDYYSEYFIPYLGEKVVGDAASYRYLIESIAMHPNQEELLRLMQESGLEDCCYRNLNGGIVAIHQGYVY